jgi:hypothetical protein
MFVRVRDLRHPEKWTSCVADSKLRRLKLPQTMSLVLLCCMKSTGIPTI